MTLEDYNRTYWVYINAAGEVLYDFDSSNDERLDFHNPGEGTRVPHPLAVDCVTVWEVSDEAWGRYINE